MRLIDKISKYLNFTKKGILLDTKPLTLYVIGNLNLSRVKTFSGTKNFSLRNFHQLSGFLESFGKIYVTPYILSELSHFTLEKKTGLSREEKKQIANLILSLSKKNILLEKLPVLKKVFSNKHIVVIGPNDASLLEASVDKMVPILTSDGVLADIARNQGRVAFKFVPPDGFLEH